MSNRHLNLPSKIYAEAVVRSVSGESLLRSSLPITSEYVSLFHSAPDIRQIAKERLEAAGFKVLDIGNTSLNIVAAPEVYEQVLGARIELIERPVTKESGQRDMAAFMNSADNSPLGEIDISQTDWTDILDGVALNDPAYYLQQNTTSAFPPKTDTRYLQVPDELATELSATLAHREGITGKGVKVVVVDSGCYTEHAFFKYHKYDLDVELGPGSANKDEDLNGHGTGVTVNVFAIAPDVSLTVLKADVALGNKKYKNINSTAAFRRAVALKPDIISCSWGSDLRNPYQLSSSHKVLASVIADAVRQGIVVIFAAGNGQWGFPAQHPDVIAVGGVYKHLEGSLKGRVEASNYASSFISGIYPKRRVPDVCGLVGQLPHAAYIMLPVPPGSGTDHGRSLIGDETGPNDGWAAFSGTSSAAPQLAGACALLEQFVPGLAPQKIREILRETASDVIDGCSHPSSGGGQARAGPDLATGYGLAVAHKAVQSAKKAYAQKQKQLPDPYSQTLMSETSSKTPETSEQVAASHYSNNKSITRRRTQMSLDDTTQRILHRDIDEIQIELNEYLRKYCLPKRKGLQNIELVIYEDDFIEETTELAIITRRKNVLREVVADNGSVDSNLIREKHVSAAKRLLKKGKCQYLAEKLLSEAATLDGKDHLYSLRIDDNIKDKISNLIEEINNEIETELRTDIENTKVSIEFSRREFLKLDCRKTTVNEDEFYYELKSQKKFQTDPSSQNDAFKVTVFIDNKKIMLSIFYSDSVSEGGGVSRKPEASAIFNEKKCNLSSDSWLKLLEGTAIDEDMINRDKIADLAEEALMEKENDLDMEDNNQEDYFGCDCWGKHKVCFEKGKRPKFYWNGCDK